ncbi:MAG: phospholipase D-like domain-containing protein [Chitinophagaceae bacterium]
MSHKLINRKPTEKPSQKAAGNVEFIELVHSGDDYFLRMKNIIENAQEEIHLQTYIFENDETGRSIAACLKEAARRKVKVYVLLDGYGSAKLPDSFTQDFLKDGVLFRFFSPFFSMNNFYLGRRMHHKILVADGKTALIGGINIAGKYNGSPDSEPWFDYAVQLRCPAATALQNLCRSIFFKKMALIKIKSVFHAADNALVRIIQNDWLVGKTEICDAYFNAILYAEKEIIIAGSYFLPGKRLSGALKKACNRGIKTTLILSGISDVPLMRRAATHLYSSYLRRHMVLYEWKKSVLHGKAAVVDDKWATVGSFNLNNLSCYGSIEMNVEVNSSRFAGALRYDFNNVISKCKQITFSTLKKKSGIANRIANWFSYQIVRTTLFFLTFLPHIRFLKKYRL